MHPLRTRSVASSSKLGQELAWKFFQEKFETIKAMLAKASPSLMNAVIISCCGGFTDDEKMKEVTCRAGLGWAVVGLQKNLNASEPSEHPPV